MENKVFRFLLKNGESYDDAGDKVNPALVALGFKLYEVGKDVAFSDKLGVWRDIDNCPMKSATGKEREAAETEVATIKQQLHDGDLERARALIDCVVDPTGFSAEDLLEIKESKRMLKEWKLEKKKMKARLKELLAKIESLNTSA